MYKNYTSTRVWGKIALSKTEKSEAVFLKSFKNSKGIVNVLLLLGTLFACFNGIGQTTTSFNYTGSTQNFVVPAGVTSINVKIWGAGGGGSAFGPSSGGSGALVKGTLAVTPGQTLILVVGGGGSSSSATGGFGGGGASGNGGGYGGSGGGGTGIFVTSVTRTNALAVAGGGGGGGYFGVITNGGAGGALAGTNAGNRNANNTGGKGATASAGGAGGTSTAASGVAGSAGGALSGGAGATTTDAGGGGGGGGYYGGGGGYSTNGTQYSSGGGGGSSYLGTMTTTTNIVGSTNITDAVAQAPGNTETEYVAGVGNGGNSTNAAGNGLIIFTYTLPPASTPSISSFTPNVNLCSGGGQLVTITGTNFTQVTAVKFNGVNAASYNVVNDTTITSITPASLTTGVVTVTNTGGTGTGGSYTVVTNPTVTISPTTAFYCTSGGTPISLAANGASTYNWTAIGGAGLSSTTGSSITSTPTTSSKITVTGADGNGCTATATSLVYAIKPVTNTATATPSLVCVGGNSQLLATPSQSYSATAAGYDFAGATGTYSPITGTTLSAALGDDVAVGNLPIGFNFTFNGSTQTVFAAASNGFIELGSTLTYTDNFSAGWTPSTNALSGRANIIAPFWGDHNTTGASVVYSTTGPVGSRVLTVQWTGIKLGGGGTGTSTLNMQVKLYEGTNAIQFIYGGNTNGTGAIVSSIGISGVVGNYLSITPLLPVNTSTKSSTSENNTINGVANIPTGTTYTLVPQVAPAYTYSWLANPTLSATNIANPMANNIPSDQTYSVTVSSNGCSVTTPLTVTTTAVGPQITTQPAVTQSKCVGGTATFAVTATGSSMTYQWRKGAVNLTNGGTISGATTATLTITGLTAGDSAANYNVVISSPCGSPATSDNAALTVVTPLAGVNASATAVCSGTSVTLTENGGSATSWSWTPGAATTNPLIVTPATTTTYTVTATTQLTGCTATANVTITVNETPAAVSVVPVSSTVCSGSAVRVNASGGRFSSAYLSETFDAVSPRFTAATVSGTTTTSATLNTTYQSQGTGSVLFNTTGTSSVATYSMNSNLNLSDATVATVTFSHIADMEGPTTAFDFGYVEYSADGGATWTTFTSSNYTGSASTGLFDSGNVRFSSRSYADWISRFTGTGIQPTNALWKTETFAIPGAALTTQFRLRFRYTTDGSTNYVGWFIDNVKINANGNIPYAWTALPATTLYTDAGLSTVYNPANFAPAVYAQPTAQTQFTVNVANGTCTNSSNATVNVNPLPVITLANSITICKGTGATVTIPENNNTYSWSPSTGVTVVSANQFTVNPTNTTTYTVTTTNTSTFCQSTKQIIVNVNDPGIVITQPSNRVVASGYSTSFTAAGTNGITYGYQWQIKTGPTSYSNLTNDGNYSGVTSAVLTVNNAGTGSALDNTFYRVLLTPPAPCAALASNDAVLTVSNTGIASSPSDVNVCLPTPSTAQFNVATNGDEPYLVEWQVSTDNGATYDTISLIDVEDTFLYTGPNTTAVPGLTFEHPLDSGNDTGANFKILNVSGISNPGSLKFKAIVNEVLPSSAATLTIGTPIGFTTNVSTTETIRCKTPATGAATTLTMATSGTVSSVEWRYDTTPGGSFSNTVTNNTPSGVTYTASSSTNNYSLDVATSASTPAGSYYYKAFVTGSSACGTTPVQSAMATITVADPAVAIAASAASYCSPGSAVSLTASGAASYSWTSVPSGFTSTLNGISVTPSVATAYTVVGTDSNGCTNSATANVGIGTSFIVAASAAPTTVCPNAAVTLNAVPTSNGPVTYLIDTVPYQFNSVAGTFTALSGTTVSSGLGNAEDDSMSGNITPGSGFNFNYGGTNYTTFRVSSNGQLVFGTSGTQAASNDLASTTATERPGLAPLWDDLLLSSGVNYQMSGTAPNRVLTIEWLNMRWNYEATGAVISFQVKLYETTNVIEYVYRRDSTGIRSGGASIGLMGTASNNFLSLQAATASPGLSTTTAENGINTKPTNGRIFRFTPQPAVSYTYAWTSAPSGFNGTGATTTANPSVNSTYTVTATNNQGCQATNTASVTVNSAPPVVTALPATLNVCAGATATFTVTATSSTPLNYQWMRNGSPLVNGSEISGATTATLSITGATAANNGNYTVAVSNCTTVNSTATALTVNPLPTAILTGTTSTCQNATQPLITFTGASGTAPYTLTYKLNGGTNQTVTTTSGSSVTLSVPTATVGSYSYTLVSVQDSSPSSCSRTQTGTVTVTVNGLPDAVALSSNSPVCAGNALNFTANVATPPLPSILSQNFESGLGSWVVTAASTGGANTAVANFNIKAHGTTNAGSTPVTFNSPGGSNFIFADPDGAGSGIALNTKLTSPSFSTVGYTAVSLSFRHYHQYLTNAPSVEVSVDNGSTWTSVASYTSDQGTPTNFATATISLTAYAGFPNVKVRYNFTGGWIWYWAIDDISITGTPDTFTYAWSGPNSFTSAVQNPSIVNATTAATGTYTLEITNANGCKASSTVNAVVGAQPTWYLDADGDHYYTGTPVVSCTSPGAGYTSTGILGGNDCNDTPVTGATIYPGATELCWNGILENCSSTLSAGCAPVVVNMVASYNGTTLTSLSQGIPAVVYTYGGYTNLKYRFTITNVNTGQSAVDIIQTSRFVVIPNSIRTYNTSYTITASAVINEEIVPYAGNTITVIAPTVNLITLGSSSCGATLATLGSTLTANPGLNATGYTFRIRTNDANPSPTYYESQSATRFVSANTFAGFPLQYGASYKVSVQFTFNDPLTNLPVQSGYGAECTINTPSIPVTTIASPTCGSTVTSLAANMSATAAPYATGYRFRIRLFNDNGPTPSYFYTVPNASRFSTLSAFQGITLAYSTAYSISVEYSILNGSSTVWSGFGAECKVTTPFFPTTSLVPSQCGQVAETPLTQQLNITPYPGFPNYKVRLEEVNGEDVGASQEITVSYPYFKLNQFSIAQNGKNYQVSVAIKLNGVFGDFNSPPCDLHTPAAAKANTTVAFAATAYPNPFANNFMIDVKTESQSNVNIKVYDMIGRMIEQRDVRISDMESTTIGNNYPSGVYNVIVSQEDSVRTVRVVKR